VIEGIFASGAGNKILFGTDWPILEYPRYETIVDRTSLTEEQRSLLLSKNAQDLLARTKKSAGDL
jgi:predicted TIM-barrel fold metal-dependent hydrolase